MDKRLIGHSKPVLWDRHRSLRLLLDQTHALIVVSPGVQIGLRYPTPPRFVLKAEGVFGMQASQFDQSVSVSFFRAYTGSVLVIQRFARFQRTPMRLSVARTVSPVTRPAVTPCSKLTSAKRPNVHTLVSLPKLRGLCATTARRRSPAAESKAACGVCAAVERFVNASSPRSLNALIAAVTVSGSQPRSCAI